MAELTASGRHGNIAQSENWKYLQQKAFTAWVNQHLAPCGCSVTDLFTELQNGVKLCTLMERLAKMKLPKKWKEKPKIKVECLENLNAALDMMKKQSVKLLAIGAEDIYDGNSKLILGLIWVLILRYHLSSGGGDVRGQMMQWVRDRISSFGIECTDLSAKSWGDGRVYVGLVHSLRPVPGVDNPATLTGEPLENVRKAMKVAEEELDIPHVLDPEDILEPEELSMLTYLGFIRDKSESQAGAPPAVQVQATGEGLSKAIVGAPASFSMTVQIEEAKAATTPRAPPAPVALSPELALCCELAFKASDKDGSGTVDFDELVHVLENLLEGRVPADKVEKIAVGQVLSLKGTTVSDDQHHLNLAEFQAIFAALAQYFPAPDVLKAAIEKLKEASLAVSSRNASLALSQSARTRATPTDFAGLGFKLEITGPNGPVAATVTSGVAPLSFGVQYEAQAPGPHEITVSYKGTKVTSWTAKAMPGGPSAEHSTAEGEGLVSAVVGLPATFSVQLRSASGEPIDGSDSLAVQIAGAAPTSLKATSPSERPGHYEVTYDATEEGPVPISVKVSGADIKGSPFSATAQRGTGKLHTTSAIGVAGTPFDFTVETEIAGSARSLVPALQVRADGTAVEGKETQTGSHAFSVVPTGPQLKLEALLAGRPIAGSPFECAVVSPDNCKLTGPEGAQRLGAAVPFTVTTCDSTGAPVSALSLLSVKFDDDAVTDPSESKPGEVRFTVAPKAAGRYQIRAELAGSPLTGSPFTLEMLPSLSAAHSLFALKHNSEAAVAGAPITVCVTARDSNGNVLADAEKEACTVTDAETREALTARYVGNGTFEATASKAAPCTVRLHASLNGEAVPPAPLEIPVRSAAVAAKSTAEGSGLGATEPGVSAEFVVRARDSEGKQVPYGGDEVKAWLVPQGPAAGERVSVDSVESSDDKGAYRVSYVVPDSGTWELHVTLNGGEIAGSPYAVTAKAVADPARCEAYGLGLKRATVGKRTSFCVNLFSSTGRPVDTPPEIKGDNIEVDVVSLGDGMYDVCYRPAKEGPLVLDVLTCKDGPHVAKSPFTVDVQPATKRVRVWTLLVSCSDELGQLQPKLTPGLKVEVTAPDGRVVPAKASQESGAYRLEIEPHMPGQYYVSVTVNGEHVTGSPFSAEHIP